MIQYLVNTLKANRSSLLLLLFTAIIITIVCLVASRMIRNVDSQTADFGLFHGIHLIKQMA
jgi:hypothetical protein